MKISIEGNIGCGKTSVLTRLFKEHRIPVFLEPVDQWKDWLHMFYDEPSRWGFTFNLNVLMSFDKWRQNGFMAFYERSPVSNRYVFAELQHDRGHMNQMEMSLFHDIYSRFAWVPDVVIYIRTDPEVSMQRMINRGRECEGNVSLEYIQAVHNKYEELFPRDAEINHRMETGKVITIDGNNTAEKVYQDLLDVCYNLGIIQK